MDVVARLYAEKLSRTLGRPVIVENKPGSAGLCSRVRPERAGGWHTLGAATSAIMAIRPVCLKKPLRSDQGLSCRSPLYLKSPFIL